MEASWDTLLSSAAQNSKVETSPTGSLLSDPAGVYPSLFSGSTVASSAAATPTDSGALSISMLPVSGDDLDFASKTAAIHGSSLVSLADEVSDDANPLVLVGQENTQNDTEANPHAAPDKKPTKKRKSWGQVLPEPKTNLPPRKRAKTEDEKEQRRVERVLRNRRAAQSSRERKRLEVEALEIRNRELEEQLAKVRRENTMLYERLTQVQGKSAVVPTANVPVTFSQELFSSQNGHSFSSEPSSDIASFLNSATINPVSLSPPLHPVPDTSDLISTIGDQETLPIQDKSGKSEELSTQKQGQSSLSKPVTSKDTDSPATTELEPSPDTTHRPAATLCPDLQCLSAEVSQTWTVPKNSTLLSVTLLYQTTLLLMLSSTMISACSRPLNQIALLLKAGISIPPTPAILTSIIWLIMTPSRRSPAQNSTLTTFSTPTCLTSHPAAIFSSATVASTLSGRPISTLRLKMLRKILTSNPMLARPIRDATMRVLRSVCSEEQRDAATAGGEARPGIGRVVQWSETGIASDGSWANKATWPSKEALLTLLWALRVEERRMSMPTNNKSRKPTARARATSGQYAKGFTGKLSVKR